MIYNRMCCKIFLLQKIVTLISSKNKTSIPHDFYNKNALCFIIDSYKLL